MPYRDLIDCTMTIWAARKAIPVNLVSTWRSGDGSVVFGVIYQSGKDLKFTFPIADLVELGDERAEEFIKAELDAAWEKNKLDNP